ncbi:MAG TPA: hypothetical protein VF545_02300 [Thermoleophilaceae bacterium]|jgi:predicted small lipoprotein YifL
MRRARSSIALVALIAVAVPIAGCGKSGPKIPKQDAADIVARLKEAERRNDPLRCDDLRQETIPALQSQVRSLGNVDKDIRETLSEGVDNLRNLVAAECSTREPKTKTDTTTSETTESTTTTTTTSPTTTEETDTETSPTTDTSPTTTDTTPTGPSGGVTPGAKDEGKGAK